VNAYLLPEVFDDRMTVKRHVSKRKVLWGTEAVASDDPRLLGNQDASSFTNKKESAFGTKIVIMDRLFSELHIDPRNTIYDVRLRMDEEYYTIETDDDSFMITVDETDDVAVLVWDYERNEVEMRPGDKLNVSVGTQVFELEVNKRSVESFTLTRI
jgi:hypothetical protein